MKLFTLALAITTSLSFPSHVTYIVPVSEPIIVEASTTPAQKVSLPLKSSVEARIAYIEERALFYGVSTSTALYIVKHESGFNCEAIGDNGTSYGCWQIHLPAHPNITEEQAKDLTFSTEWALKQLKAGNCHIWTTCPH